MVFSREVNTRTAADPSVKELEEQSRVSDELLRSYRAQFNVGRRSLLDVLMAARQPSFGSPITSSSGTNTSSRKISLSG